MTAPEQMERSISVATVMVIQTPTPQRERRIALRIVDWNRIKRTVRSLRPPDAWIPVVYGAWLGISGSAFLSIPQFLASESVPSWVIPAYVSVGLAGVVIAGALIYFERKLGHHLMMNRDDILRDMEDSEIMDDVK